MNMPRVGIKPHPSGVADLHVADHAFFVIRVNTPRMRVHQPNQWLICDRLIADTQGKVGDRAVGRRKDLGLLELPLQISDIVVIALTVASCSASIWRSLATVVSALLSSAAASCAAAERSIKRLARQKTGVRDGLRPR